MSVPVRYSAAANYAVVDESGLCNTPLTQEEQYYLLQQHQQQQYQYQQLQQHEERQQQQQFAGNFNYIGNNMNGLEKQQQQLMQQRSSMMSPSSAASSLSSSTSDMSSSEQEEIELIEMIDEVHSAAAAAAVVAVNHNNINNIVNGNNNNNSNKSNGNMMKRCNNDGNENATMQTEWMQMSDEGRFGTPGAAGLDYQKYELEQQQLQQRQQREQHNIDNMGNNMESMDNEQANVNVNNPENNTSNLDSTTRNALDELEALSAEQLYDRLKEYDVLQDKHHTILFLPEQSNREVTMGGRDGSAYVLRCLKMWYELPSDVLFAAMSLVDRFLDRMTVKPKHMACLSVASLHLAIKQLSPKPIPAEDLVTISQCGCTAGDLERMAGVIAQKLGVQMDHKPITAINFLRIFYILFRNMAREIGGDFFDFFERYVKYEDLENRLENLLCDVKTTVVQPSTLALVTVCLHMDSHIKSSYPRGRPELKVVFEFIMFVQRFMRIPDRVFSNGFGIVANILVNYNNQNKQPYKQRLVWKLSSRTLRVLRPINRFSSDLATIEETMPTVRDNNFPRSRAESISSEEEEDWPTSPIIPIFEQC